MGICPPLAPLKGELSAQLTEGFRLGISQASPKGKYRFFTKFGPVFPFPTGAFPDEKPKPLSLG